jgi:hypothetical protein
MFGNGRNEDGRKETKMPSKPKLVELQPAPDSLTHAKSVLISPPDVAIDHLFPPYTKEKVQAMDQWFDY